MDQYTERNFLAVAHALFMNRLHLLRLTEVVRLGIRPDPETKTLDLPERLDREMRQSAVDFVFACFPREMHGSIEGAKAGWLNPA
jgi:hypothetical protein